MSAPHIGIIALQGAAAPHRRILEELGAIVTDVRAPGTVGGLDGLDGIVMPGGESTTMGMLLQSSGLMEPLVDLIDDEAPVLATCAGLILLSSEVAGGRSDQVPLKRLDIAIRRNAFGRQNESFEAPVTLTGDDLPFPALFIRAPSIESVGPDVKVLGTFDGSPALVRQGSIVATTFHPELSNDDRVHRMFLGGH